jgi:hypothetical protein
MSTSKRRSRDASVGAETLRGERAPGEDNGRDARGRFAAGNKFGPGNPFARKVAALRTALIETVTEEDMRFIAEQLVVTARLGDMAAIKLLFQYVLGKPAAAVDPDTLGHQELDLYWRGPSPDAVQELACERLPADAVADVLRIEMPCLGASFKDKVARGAGRIGPDDKLEDHQDGVEEEKQEAAAPSPNREVADNPRRTMTAMSANGFDNQRADAAPLLEKLAAVLLEKMAAPPSTNGASAMHHSSRRGSGNDDSGGDLSHLQSPERQRLRED